MSIFITWMLMIALKILDVQTTVVLKSDCPSQLWFRVDWHFWQRQSDLQNTFFYLFTPLVWMKPEEGGWACTGNPSQISFFLFVLLFFSSMGKLFSDSLMWWIRHTYFYSNWMRRQGGDSGGHPKVCPPKALNKLRDESHLVARAQLWPFQATNICAYLCYSKIQRYFCVHSF